MDGNFIGWTCRVPHHLNNLSACGTASTENLNFPLLSHYALLIDSYLYYSGRVDTTLPFDELRRRSLINEDAQAADGAPESEFSQRIRASLPTITR
jgi:hypothetical protein